MTIFDQFRIKSVTWTFWIEDTARYTEDNYAIPEVTYAYDPDCAGRDPQNIDSVRSCANSHVHQFMPNRKLKIKLYPYWMPNYTGFTDKGLIRFAKATWFDAADLSTTSEKCRNGFLLAFLGNSTTKIKYTHSIHYQFRGQRNGSGYK